MQRLHLMPSLEDYIWDVGPDETGEILIDKAIRMLLLEKKFDTEIWTRWDKIDKIYDDKRILQVVSQALSDLNRMCQKEIDVSEHGSTSKKLYLTAEELDQLHEIFCAPQDPNYSKEDRSKTASLSKTEQDQLRKDKQLCLWSFLLSLACTIKYLEIETLSTPLLFQLDELREIEQERRDEAITSPRLGSGPGEDREESDSPTPNKTKRMTPLNTAIFVSDDSADTRGVGAKNSANSANSGTAGGGGESGARRASGARRLSGGLLNIRKHNKLLATESLSRSQGDQGSNENSEMMIRHTTSTFDGTEQPHLRVNTSNEMAFGPVAGRRDRISQKEMFNVYKLLVCKFIIEYENSDVMDDLWPWYENYRFAQEGKHLEHYNEIFKSYFKDTGLSIESNHMRSKMQHQNSSRSPGQGNYDHPSMQSIQPSVTSVGAGGSTISTMRTKFASPPFGSADVKENGNDYRYIRYLRKFAAMFLLNENEVAQRIFHIRKEIKSKRQSELKLKKQMEEIGKKKDTMARHRKRMGKTQDFKKVLQSMMVVNNINHNDDTSFIQNDPNHPEFEVTEEDRAHIKEYFLEDDISQIWLENYLAQMSLKDVDTAAAPDENNALTRTVTTYEEDPNYNTDAESPDAPDASDDIAGIEYKQQDASEPRKARSRTSSIAASPSSPTLQARAQRLSSTTKVMSALNMDVQQHREVANKLSKRPFLQFWVDLPEWWQLDHDMLLLELSLMYDLASDKYVSALKKNKFYETWAEAIEGKLFIEWLQKKNNVNVMHRLRYLLYVLIYKERPRSTVFTSDSMHESHVSFVSSAYARADMSKLNTPRKRRKSKSIAAAATSSASASAAASVSASLMSSPLNLSATGATKVSNNVTFEVPDNGTDPEDELEEVEVKPVRNIETEFRQIVQLLEPERFGAAIWNYIITQLQHKQRESIWKALIIVASELPSSEVVKFLERDREMIRRGKLEYVELLCRAIVESCMYPMAMSLHISKFLHENANRDLARYHAWHDMSVMFEDIAVRLIYEIENDFLLALMMEMPINSPSNWYFNDKSIFEIAIEYHRTSFCNDSRISALLSHMWVETEFLNPKHGIKATDLRFDKIFLLLFESPVRFYFCPLGLYYTTSVTYIMYVLAMTYIVMERFYPYSEMLWTELLLWVMNAGYIFYEVSEVAHKKAKYFAADSILNVFDVIISITWIILAFMRFIPLVIKSQVWKDEVCIKCGEGENIALVSECRDSWAYPDAKCSIESNNNMYIIVYMGLFSVQCVILWVRVIGLFQRTELLGPFLRVLFLIFKDLVSFFLLATVVFIAFTLALYYIIAGDLDRDWENEYYSTDDTSDSSGDDVLTISDDDKITIYLNSLKGCTLYIIQTFLGQQDWEVLNENEPYNLSRERARLAEGLILVFVLIGTILLLNLLIAVMSNTFNIQQAQAQKELAFSRLETTYDLAHRGREMPPPFNLFARLVWIGIEVLNFVKPNYFTVDRLNPYFYEKFNNAPNKIIVKSDEAKLASLQRSEREKKELSQVDDTESDAIEIDVLEAEGRGRRYCKYCYVTLTWNKYDHAKRRDAGLGRMDANEVQNYFLKLEKSGYSLDQEDRRYIERLFRYGDLCPTCFRPYLSDTDDWYTRHKVFTEIASFYTFMALVYVPLLMILIVPAAFAYYFNMATKLPKETDVGVQNKARGRGDNSFADFHRGSWHKSTKAAIASVELTSR